MRRILIAISFSLLSQSVHAQASAAALAIGGIDKLIDKVEWINLYYGSSVRGTTPDDHLGANGYAPWHHDYGLEFVLHLSDFGGAPSINKYFLPFNGEKTKRARTLDTTKTTIKLGAQGPEIQVETTPVKPPRDAGRFEFDLGIGYGQLDGIATHAPFEVHANVRELPAVSLYGNYALFKDITFYIGGRTGLIALQDAQFYLTKGDTTFRNDGLTGTNRDSTTAAIGAAASTFESGLTGGIDVAIGHIEVTAEFAWTNRHFNSITYSPATQLPYGFPHELNFSGRSLELAIQLPMPGK